MPWPYLIYVAFNLAFNIVLLILLKKASALQGFMALKAIVPVTVLLFYFEWPLIGRSNVNLWILIGLAVIMVGLVLYRMFSNIQKEHKQYAGCFSVGLPCGKYHKLYYSKPSIVN
jgi:glycerol-3-phosphate acyltransferase PlsY